MYLIDGFFAWVLSIQLLIGNFENWYISKRKYIPWVYFLSPIIGMVFIYCKLVILGEIVVFLGMVFIAVDNIVGWKHSVRKWLKICVIYNLLFSLMLTGIVQGIVNNTVIDTLFIIIYLLVWFFLSLISNSKVALLVNEIVSSVATTIFTIGTYLVSMALRNMSTSKDYLSYFHSDEAIELTSVNEEVLACKSTEIIGLEMLEVAFAFWLPIIGVTVLTIIMIKMKVYWMEKNGISETQIENGDSGELDKFEKIIHKI